MKNFFNRYKTEILAFFIPIFIFAIACIFSNIWPFGNHYIAAYDGSAQYPGFTTYLTNVLKGNESLLYSFKGGLGYNFYATAVYYLFNPTNLLSVFFNKDNIMVFYTLVVFLRIGLSGYTMSLYLKNKDKLNKGRLIFSIAYALMAYNVLYFYNFMYFDTVVLLPLVILGLDKLIDKNKPALYIIFLTISIISNFYIGSMVCIFSLLYFIYRFICLDKENRNKKLIFTFIMSSLLAGLLTAFVLLPEYFELLSGKASLYGSQYTVYNKWGMDFFTSFYRLSIASYSIGEQSNGDPNIYVSIFVFIYTILFFFNKKVSKKEKIVTGSFIAFFLLCFSYNLLDYAWQFFQKPIWYPNRYSFIFSFLIIITGYKSFNLKEGIQIKPVISIILTTIIIALVINASLYSDIISQDTSKIIFLILSCICIVEYMISYKLPKLPLILIFVFILEITANTVMAIKQISFSKTEPAYSTITNDLGEAFNYIEKIDPIENNFYRLDSNTWQDINNAGSFNYNGMIYFNSIRNGKMMYFLENYAGYTVQDECSVRFNAKNPVLTSMLGFKYIVSSNEENYYKKILDQKYDIYLNNDNLSLGFMVNNKIKNLKLEKNKSYSNSEKIVNLSLGKANNLITPFTYNSIDRYWEEEDEDGITYVYYNSQDGGYVLYKGRISNDSFLFLNNSLIGKHQVDLKLNNKEEIKSINSQNFSPILLKAGDTFEIKAYFSTSRLSKEELELYLMDYDIYKNWINEMKKNQLVITDYKKDNKISGTINVTKDKTALYTSIPYNEGWRVYVDGKKSNYYMLLDSFIGLDLKEGNHKIEFVYIPKGLIPGIIISGISLIGTIAYLKRRK